MASATRLNGAHGPREGADGPPGTPTIEGPAKSGLGRDAPDAGEDVRFVAADEDEMRAGGSSVDHLDGKTDGSGGGGRSASKRAEVLKSSLMMIKGRMSTFQKKKRGGHEEPAHASISVKATPSSLAESTLHSHSHQHSAPSKSFSFRRKKQRKAPRHSADSAHDEADLNDWGMTREEETECLAVFEDELARVEGVEREHLEDEKKLLRFLRARNFDLPRAMDMYLKHLKWREDWDVDSILFKNFPERQKLLDYYPQGYHMCDKQGRPIYIQYLGGINVHKILGFTNQETILKIFIQEYEKFLHFKLPACSEAHGKLIETSLNIMDVSGISLRMLTKESQKILKAVTGFTQDNYPEMMGNMIIINAPYIFKVIFNIVKPMLSPRTQSKIIVLGSRYMDKLLEYVDIDCIPEKIGGTSEYTIFDDVGPWSDLAPSVTTKEQLDLYKSQQISKWAESKGGQDSCAISAKQAELSELRTIDSQQTVFDSDDEACYGTTRSLCDELALASSPTAEGGAGGGVVVEKPALLVWIADLENQLEAFKDVQRSRTGAGGGHSESPGPSLSLVARIGCLEAEIEGLLGALEPGKDQSPTPESAPSVRVESQPAWIGCRSGNGGGGGGKRGGTPIVDRMRLVDEGLARLKLGLVLDGGEAKGSGWWGSEWLAGLTCCFGVQGPLERMKSRAPSVV